MQFWMVILSLHILFVGIWLVNFIADPIFKNSIASAKNLNSESNLISLYLKFVNLLGMIGATGILVTGILMVVLNPGYEFFQFSANHWLTAKQIVMVVILFLLGVKVIPAAKKLRLSISSDLKSPVEDKIQVHENLKSLYQVNFQMNLLVIINLLLAITRYLYS